LNLYSVDSAEVSAPEREAADGGRAEVPADDVSAVEGLYSRVVPEERVGVSLETLSKSLKSLVCSTPRSHWLQFDDHGLDVVVAARTFCWLQ
jgi:hypothetical protein